MAGWKSSLASVLKEHNGIKASDGTVASHETQHKRSTVLYQAFTDLREMGYKLGDVRQLKGRHVEALTKHWLSKGLSSSTLQNRLSTLRTFASWIGKEGMVESAERYFPNHEAARTSINIQNKGWEANGLSVTKKLDDLRALDEDTRFIAVIANYHNTDVGQWKQRLRVEPKGRQYAVLVQLDAAQVSLKGETR